MRNHIRWWGWLLVIGLLLPWQFGCVAQRLTDQLSTVDGPPLRCARMSSTLGVTRLKDGRIVIVGGSQLESPFEPIVDSQSPRTIEVLDKDLKEWKFSNIKVPYPLSGKAFALTDSQGLTTNRVLVMSAIYVFNKDDDDPKKNGAVSAVILDFDKGSVTPLYRPFNNDPKKSPLTGNGPALLQRAFARTIQLKDGRILRAGGRAIYTSTPLVVECTKNQCSYCQGKDKNKTCKPHPDHQYACAQVSDCPSVQSPSQRVVLPDVELYLPPSSQNPLGSVKRWKMKEGRYNLDLRQLKDGRVLITGGQNVGTGDNHRVYRTSYIFDTTLGKEKLIEGPRMTTSREDHSSLVLENGEVLILGGTDESRTTVRTSERFDPVRNLFYTGEQVLVPREDHIPVLVGAWGLFLGGEIDSAADNILNSAEAFNLKTGAYIGNFLLFPLSQETKTRLTINDLDVCECERKKLTLQECLKEKQQQLNTRRSVGYAGIDDFAAIKLDNNRLLILGGQQGKQDPDGKYINSGEGSRRTLILTLPTIQ